MSESILQFTRDKVVAMAQQGMMHITSPTHWEICDSLKKGKTMEVVADDFKVHYNTVQLIKKCKCPDVQT